MNALALFAEPGFVIPWYVVGAIGAVWVGFDLYRVNTPLKEAMKWAWPIIVLFFSVLGLLVYFATARAPGIAKAGSDKQKRKLHEAYEQSMLRRVNGAVIHCVAGDGLGIMTAMVIARAFSFTFWQEFWFEYLVGFTFGWLIFQYKSMKMMTDDKTQALWMAFRAEFLSMLTVMGGMGAVMTFVTPMLVGAQPQPLTFAFWGFGMLGLLVGYTFTFPMNWMLLKVGWKHGMGSQEGARPVKAPQTRTVLFAGMWVLGLAALALPAWLTVLREAQHVDVQHPDVTRLDAVPLLLARGLNDSVAAARRYLEQGDRREGTQALDGAMRAAEVAKTVVPDDALLLAGVQRARRVLQNGDRAEAARILANLHPSPQPGNFDGDPADPKAYRDVEVINAQGDVIGEIRDAQLRVQLALGGAHDVLGVFDMRPAQIVWVPRELIVFGPLRTLGKSYAMVLTFGTPPLALGPGA